MKKQRVVIGMSGGVDSSVAALLLKEQGYDVVGLFMNNWEETDENGCCPAEQDFADVRRVCDKIQIPYYSVNFAQNYLDRVFSYFIEEYSKGRTPNPDVLCNREIKFGPFKDYALSMDADFIATGHYCKILHENGVHHLLKAKDQNKDQTDFLNQLSQNQLDKVLFPLADLDKSEVRKIAEQNDLYTARKKDSTGICFIGERKFREFLMKYIPAREGLIKTYDGRVLGKHYGLMYYTIGQRKGLDVGGQPGDEGRWFVIEKDLKNNVLYVAHGNEQKLYSKGLYLKECNWIPSAANQQSFRCNAKFRYRQSEQGVTVTFIDKTQEGYTIRVDFDQPQRAITEGQYCVFYNQTACLGGGVIEGVIF
ncbi:MAG: tRNA 2-thiouridine(34) synthase MnmA [Clostridia bacterium]|nr:tRNA 2-thiouridine(34) synthase MnmA [Clostridia bacterium]